MALPKGLKDGLSIYTQEETRLVRGTAVLLDFDAQQDFHNRQLLVGSSVSLERPLVPVYEGGTKIGAATVYMNGRKVEALITFDYETPERLDLMVGNPVWVVPIMEYYVNEDNEVDYIDVTSISLDRTPHKLVGGLLSLTRYLEA